MRNRNNEQESSEAQDDKQLAGNSNDAVEADGSPVLDEQDLEEMGLSEEEADQIEWEEPK